MPDNNALRRSLRAARLQLSKAELRAASEAACTQVLQQREFINARRVAGYVSSKGEIDPMPLLQLAHDMGKQCYLPVLHPFLNGRLWFARWSPDSVMHANRFGIPEPTTPARDCCRPQFINLMLVPLLGFDAQCHRLGMGGGFYDRTLAFRNQRRAWKGPHLIGLAHEAQRCETLNVEPWDVSLDRVLTATSIYRC